MISTTQPRHRRRTVKETQSGGTMTINSKRLPFHIIPDSYLICLKPRWDHDAIEGCVIVHLTITAEARELWLNAVELKVGKIMWEEDVTENRQEPLEYGLDEDMEMLKIVFEPPLNPSTGHLRINFNGQISMTKETGLYKAGPAIGGSEIHDGYYPLVSSFEPASARRVFPCWDEPGFQATFELIMVVPKGLMIISNMPQKTQYPHRSKKSLHVVEFMKSPPMSTYLFCLCIVKTDCLFRIMEDHFVLRFFVDHEKKRLAEAPLDLVQKLLPFFAEYFDIPFPLPKLDLIALPNKAADGTENWGLITARESSLLAGGKHTVIFEQSLHLLLSYLLAQQWVGNIVSIKWYNCLWLNKGLATFMQHMAVDNLDPNFEVWPQFISESLIKALEADSSRHARALEANLNSPTDVTEAIEAMAVRKGAAIIRMLYKYLGPDDFRAGLTYFLTQYENQAVTSQELWQTMEEATGQPVEAIFSTWTKNAGYPLVKVSAKQDGNYRVFTLSQEKFYGDPSAKEAKPTPAPSAYRDSKEPLWSIPITFSSPHKPELQKVVLERRSMTVQVLIGRAQWVNINPGHFGFFRVRYSSDCFTQFLPSIRQKALPVIDRLALLSDLYALVQNGTCSSVELLSVLEAYIDEAHYAVWKLICDMFVNMEIMLDGTDFHRKFTSFAKFIMSNVTEKTTWDVKEHEGHLFTLRRPVILSTLIQLNHDPSITKAQKLFDHATRGDAVIPEDLRTLVYKAVLGSAEEEVIRQIFKMYRDADSMEDKERIADALGGIKEEEKLKLLLDFCISDDVKPPHTVNILASMAVSKTGRDLAWNFFKEHWTLFRHRYAGTSRMIMLVRGVIQHFSTEEKATEVAEFFKEHHIPGVESTVQMCCEAIRIKDAWMKRDSTFIQDYLSTYA